jgi:DNA-binding response OmpR family regulator
VPNVLIIEDEPSSCSAVVSLLEREGIDAVCATDAREALAQLRRNDPDLVLLDLGMPRTDGLELLDAMLDEPRFAHLKVVVFSGRTDPDTQAQARRLGAVDFIPKGTSWQEIRQRIFAQLELPA